MERKIVDRVILLVAAALVVGYIVLFVTGAVLFTYVPDDGPERDIGIACGRSDPTRYSNVTYVPFESLNETQQQILKPALENGSTFITDEEQAAIDHWFFEYENQTYRCSGGMP